MANRVGSARKLRSLVLGLMAGVAWAGCSSSSDGPVAGTGGNASTGTGGNSLPGSGGATVPVSTGGSTGGSMAGSGGTTATGSGGAATSTGGAGGGSAGGTGGKSGSSTGGGGGGASTGGAGGGAVACQPGMVPIPSKNQSFMMGLDANEAPLQANGQPWACYLGKHQVTFTYDYCMDSNLVTQGQFMALMGFNPSTHTGDLKLPVDSETWYDAVLYSNKKSLQDGLQPAYTLGAITLRGMSASNIASVTLDLTKNGYRLPTNAEYEYAERGNTTGLYFFSATNTSATTALGAVYAWYSGNSPIAGVTTPTHPVGLRKPNPFGLYDIVGNLFEWEYDWEGPYVTTPEVDPIGPAVGTGCGGFDIGIQRMAKGGSWNTDVNTHMRISYHFKWPPAQLNHELGFRTVATVSGI